MLPVPGSLACRRPGRVHRRFPITRRTRRALQPGGKRDADTVRGRPVVIVFVEHPLDDFRVRMALNTVVGRQNPPCRCARFRTNARLVCAPLYQYGQHQRSAEYHPDDVRANTRLYHVWLCFHQLFCFCLRNCCICGDSFGRSAFWSLLQATSSGATRHTITAIATAQRRRLLVKSMDPSCLWRRRSRPCVCMITPPHLLQNAVAQGLAV